MELTLAYQGRSQLAQSRGNRTLSLAANRNREAVAFDAELQTPVRFREAISTLHDVVINDLRFKPRDKTAYHQWKHQQHQQESSLRSKVYQQAKQQVLQARADIPADLEEQYHEQRQLYWSARRKYMQHLHTHDATLWRRLMPLDPVVTVADDALLFECFSADESSYGCLSASRNDVFRTSAGMQLGTTNVDYSWDLYDHFQSLRSYRQTRFQVDPEGVEVASGSEPALREEKIELPPAWLRGFMQIQVAMNLPLRRVTLSRGCVYSMLAWLKRTRAKTSPRAVRFELQPGKAPTIVLEPWERAIVSQGTLYDGPPTEPIRIWGRRRLLVLSRLLPLVERVEVYLLGTGLPSFWVAHLGDMQLTLGLSGWTANDWTHGSALDSLSLPVEVNQRQTARAAEFLQARRAVSFADMNSHLMSKPATCAAVLNHLAHSGQAIYDLSAGVYRWRQIMPQVLGEAQLGPENAELVASRDITSRGQCAIQSQQKLNEADRLIVGTAEGKQLELVLSSAGTITKGKCQCSHHYKLGIRGGACRHLLALRQLAMSQTGETDDQSWYTRLLQQANN